MVNIIKKWTESSLILKIVIGLIIGAILGIAVPKWTIIGFPGELFVSALKAIAPLLVFVLVASAISKAKSGIGGRFKTVIILYLFSTFISSSCRAGQLHIPGFNPSFCGKYCNSSGRTW